MIHKQYEIEVVERSADGGQIVINTAAVDRERDRVWPSGAILDDYLANPVVQWGHNYHEPWATIGRTVGIEKTDAALVARFELRPPASESDPQHIVRLLWEGGWVRAASVGFIPDPDHVVDNEHGGRDYRAWRLLEWSLVPIPANQEALRLAVKGLGDGAPALEVRSVVPYADHGTAQGDWSKPVLGDFTSEPFEELSAAERRRIAAHFTWSARMPPETFGALKLPHHRPSRDGVGPAVWRGVAAAMSRLMQAGTDIPDSDRRGCYNHLARHYEQFDAEPPEFRAAGADSEYRDVEAMSAERADKDAETELPPEMLDALAEALRELKTILGD